MDRREGLAGQEIINKTMDPSDLDTAGACAVIAGLNALVRELKEKKLRVSSWYGQFDLAGNPILSERINRGYGYTPLEGAEDDVNFPWFLYWEIAWVFVNNEFRPGQKVLDLGGSSSLFSYYLASLGCDVTTIDLQRDLVDNANEVAGRTGWALKNHVMDMAVMDFPEKFDHITSICVYEHIPLFVRVKINQRVKALLVDGGKFSITFDYKNPSRAAMINTPEDVYEQFVKPSGLKVRGNDRFQESGKNYLLHPFYYNKALWWYKKEAVLNGHFRPWEFFRTKDKNDYTFGALFQEKCRER